MTKEEILQALRLTAMGRAGHPLQEQLAEKLAEVFQTKTLSGMVAPMSEAVELAKALQDMPDGSISPAETPLVKRTRKAKAE